VFPPRKLLHYLEFVADEKSIRPVVRITSGSSHVSLDERQSVDKAVLLWISNTRDGRIPVSFMPR
jgi:hypothetical protein